MLLTKVDERTLAFRSWIDAMMAKSGLNKTQLAKRAGLSHSTLSRAMSDDDYKINFRADTIVRLADAGGVTPPPVVSGIAETIGFAEPDAIAWTGPAERALAANQTIWTVKSAILQPMGIMPGDRFILDQAATPRTRDTIVVQQYDHQLGTAETLLRVYADGFAVTPLYLLDGSKRLWIDGQNVAVAGVILESWRTRAS